MFKYVCKIIEKKVEARKKEKERVENFLAAKKKARIIDKKTIIIDGVYRECFD